MRSGYFSNTGEGSEGQTQFGVPVYLTEIEARYKAGTVRIVFNPVYVKRIRSIADLSGYLTKYITKQAIIILPLAMALLARGEPSFHAGSGEPVGFSVHDEFE